MFKQIFIDKSKKTVIFLVVYTILFFLFFSTLSYTLPFVLAFAISIFTKPLNKFLKKKLKTSSSISAILSTLIVFTILLLILSAILFKVINEIRLLLESLPDINTLGTYLDNFINYLDKFDFPKFDFNLVDKFYSQISTIISSTLNVTRFVMNKALSFVVGLPMLLMVAFITFLATYFFSKDMPNIETRFLSVFSSSGRFKVRHILRESKKMLFGYLKSYACILSLTFVETLIGLTILGIDYALILSFITAIVDLLPVLGVGSVLMPMALYFYLTGNNFIAIGLVIMFLLITIIRQVLEPKLMSTNLGIHPVLILGSIFIGLKAYGFLGVIYLLGVVVLYNILNKVEIL